jgi:hypothetical protein
MKSIYSLLFLFVAFNANAQLVFKSTNVEKCNISKFIVSQNETQLFVVVNNKETLLTSWNKTPSNIKSKEGQSQFKMTVVQQEKGVKITYEIQYSLFRKTNKHLGYIKTIYSYLDTRPSKITEDYFNIY